MPTLFIALGSLIAYFIAYHTYGKWLGRKIFRLSRENLAPSTEQCDGMDFVPTAKSVVFGHHFTSIAGTGPIVGPALAVIWGWVPAVLWVIFGSIFIGAVHDFGALVVSMRNKGQTVGEIAGSVLSQRARILFLSVLFVSLTIVLAIFGLVIAAVLKMFPAAIFPCLIQIPLAIAIGHMLHRRGKGLLMPSIISLCLMYVTVIFGDWGPLHAFNEMLAAWPVIIWVAVLLIYSYIASVLPVWLLLQPRDYINSLQLLSVIGLLVVGLFFTAIFGFEVGGVQQSLEISAPAARLGENTPKGAPWIFPFLFITIACGAISGFHCLVSSGTSSKQLKYETDATFIGFGSMLTEGFLAILVILACVAGIGMGVLAPGGEETIYGEAAYQSRYMAWNTSGGLAATVNAFVSGAGNFVKNLGFSGTFSTALMGVFVASFAATTLDTACRLQRYVTQELAGAVKFRPLTNKHAATLFAITLAAIIAVFPAPGAEFDWKNLGKGGLILWPLFGATNQLLAGLAFVVVMLWMHRNEMPIWFVAIPTIIMLILPAVAMVAQIFIGENAWLLGESPNYLLATMGIITLSLEAWILIEAFQAWRHHSRKSC